MRALAATALVSSDPRRGGSMRGRRLQFGCRASARIGPVPAGRVWWLALLAATSCVPSVRESVRPGIPYVDPEGSAQTLHERTLGPPVVEGRVDGANIDLEVHQRTSCRTVDATPMLQDRTTERRLNGGPTSYYWNTAWAVVLAGAGGYLAF